MLDWETDASDLVETKIKAYQTLQLDFCGRASKMHFSISSRPEEDPNTSLMEFIYGLTTKKRDLRVPQHQKGL